VGAAGSAVGADGAIAVERGAIVPLIMPGAVFAHASLHALIIAGLPPALSQLTVHLLHPLVTRIWADAGAHKDNERMTTAKQRRRGLLQDLMNMCVSHCCETA
jgi:hypothetical protein